MNKENQSALARLDLKNLNSNPSLGNTVSQMFSKYCFYNIFVQNMDEQAVATFPSGLSFKCVSLTRHCQLPS